MIIKFGFMIHECCQTRVTDHQLTIMMKHVCQFGQKSSIQFIQYYVTYFPNDIKIRGKCEAIIKWLQHYSSVKDLYCSTHITCHLKGLFPAILTHSSNFYEAQKSILHPRILWDTGNALKITFPTISVLFLGLNLTKTKANSCTFFFHNKFDINQIDRSKSLMNILSHLGG